MTVFNVDRLGDSVTWRRVKPGDERIVCELFDPWPYAVTRPRLGPWVGGGPLPYADALAGVSAQILADHGINYTAAFENRAGDVRAVVVEGDSVAFVDRRRIVLATRNAEPYHVLHDLLAWMRACGMLGTVETWVGYGASADAGSVLLDSVDPTISVIGWPD